MIYDQPQGVGWAIVYCDSDQKIWTRINPESGNEESYVQWVNPDALYARVAMLEYRISLIEGSLDQ